MTDHEIKTCECCGAVIPTIEDHPHLTTIEYKIYEAVAKNPKIKMKGPLGLMAKVYADRPPASSNCITVHLNKINKKLIGYKIKANRSGPGAYYRLIKDTNVPPHLT